MEALARARAFRAEAHAARPSEADIAARVDTTHQRAQERGQVEKTAGESGSWGGGQPEAEVGEVALASTHGQGKFLDTQRDRESEFRVAGRSAH